MFKHLSRYDMIRLICSVCRELGFVVYNISHNVAASVTLETEFGKSRLVPTHKSLDAGKHQRNLLC